jgi:DNA adenine methylase
VNRAGSTPSHDWASYPEALQRIIERLQGVVIESMEAIGVLEKYDAPDALHYVDPPYLAETRQERHGYIHELSDLDHVALSNVLKTLKGTVIISGYPSPLYEELYAGGRGWTRVERPSFACCAKPRTEVMWIKSTEAI